MLVYMKWLPSRKEKEEQNEKVEKNGKIRDHNRAPWPPLSATTLGNITLTPGEGLPFRPHPYPGPYRPPKDQ